MNILGLDTTGNVASCAVINENIIISEFTINHKLNHSQTILPLVSQVLKAVQMDLQDMDYIACTCGPGSFTGLRIGGAAAKALAHGAGKKIVPVPTLDALAYNILSSRTLIVPVMDARRNQVYTCIYENLNEELVKITDYMAEDMHSVIRMVQSYDKEAIFLGDGIHEHKDLILSKGYKIAAPNNNMQRAASVAQCALNLIKKGEDVSYEQFELIYLRKPQAEREYEEKFINDNNR